MSEITLIIGGTRSGKSHLAEARAVASKLEVLYVATCLPGDEELLERVRRHRARRPAHWTTIEEPLDPATIFTPPADHPRVMIIECLSFLIFNWMERGDTDTKIDDALDRLIVAARASNDEIIIVSNEVGFSLIAPDPVSRRYQEILGRANQRIAAAADRVLLTVAGLPLVIKPGGGLCED